MTRSRSESQLAEAYRWATREGGKVSIGASRVLVEILTYTDIDTGVAYPRQSTLAQNLYDTPEPTRSQINYVSRCVSRLESAGLLGREQMTYRGQKSVNLYRLRIGNRSHSQMGTVHTPSVSGDPSTSVSGDPSRSVSQKYPMEVSKEVSIEGRGRGHLSLVGDQ